MESSSLGLGNKKKMMVALKNKFSLCLFLSAEVGRKRRKKY
jgi:hypothetical protein